MAYQNILSERVEKVAVITLNRPEKLNAMSYELASDLDEELCNIEDDDEVRCVVLTGAGPRAFSSGGDIHQMVKSTPEEMAARMDKRREMNWHLATFRKPIIGAINGIAYGAGAQLTTMLDIRIGCENTEIQFLAAKYGRANSTWSLPLVVGMPKAKELLYTGRPIRAEEAERIGLLNQVVPSSQLLDSSIAMAKQIGENDPRMVQGIKKLLDDGVGTLWRERFDAEQNARKNKLKANSPREGFKAFLERKGIR
ncbi:MAG TPA: enoyl-CoA hydratase/isomerase family protein [Candidatus Binatia bacterium]|nr:enoyl-CoA hydratase/isomerase family protein [Candidatus Binatia bacterium]